MEEPVIYIGLLGVSLLFIGTIYTFMCKRPEISMSKMCWAGSGIYRNLNMYVISRYIPRIKGINILALAVILIWLSVMFYTNF